jgi:hypothetical protein
MQWKGPYEVLEKVGELDYKIKIKGKVKVLAQTVKTLNSPVELPYMQTKLGPNTYPNL